MFKELNQTSHKNIYFTYLQEQKFLKELLGNISELEEGSLQIFAKFIQKEHPELNNDINLIKKHIQGIYSNIQSFESRHQTKISILNVVEHTLQKMVDQCDFSELGYFQYVQNKYFELKHKFNEWQKQEDINNF